jgi:hypothetical protein
MVVEFFSRPFSKFNKKLNGGFNTVAWLTAMHFMMDYLSKKIHLHACRNKVKKA